MANLIGGKTISVSTFNVAGAGVTATAAELNILDGVTSTAAELNLIDGGTARGTTAVASGDGVLINDGGQMRMTNVDTLDTYYSATTKTLTNKTLTSSVLTTPSITTSFTIGNATITEAEIEIIDGATITTAELNLIDGGTSRGTTTVGSGDGILINDGGTMRMTNVDTVSTYFASHSVGGSNVVTTGALNSGSITSGFGTIDTGSSTITTTGLISGGSLDIDDVLINGTTIGHTDDTDLMTLADGILTVAGDGKLSGDVYVDTIRRYSDSSTTTKIRLQDEVIKFNAGHSSNETVKIENNAITATGTLTVGVNDTGYDVKFFGATASAYMLWDENVDDLILAGVAGLIVPDGQFTLGSTAVTSTAAELNLLDGVSGLVQADLTKLAAVDATATELNYTDGVTSAIQTQLTAKEDAGVATAMAIALG